MRVVEEQRFALCIKKAAPLRRWVFSLVDDAGYGDASSPEAPRGGGDAAEQNQRQLKSGDGPEKMPEIGWLELGAAASESGSIQKNRGSIPLYCPIM